jgi:GTP-binding protein
VLATSSATGAGVRELAELLLRLVPDAAPAPAESTRAGARAGGSELAEHMVFRPSGSAGFQVERLGEGAFAVRGRGIERLLERFDIDNEDAMAYLEGRLRRIGVLGALEAQGFQPGDEIEIAGMTFELDPQESF